MIYKGFRSTLIFTKHVQHTYSIIRETHRIRFIHLQSIKHDFPRRYSVQKAYGILVGVFGLISTVLYFSAREMKEAESLVRSDTLYVYPMNEESILKGIYMALPLRYLSRIVGYLCSMELPEFTRSYIYITYSWLFGCNLEEIDRDLHEYKSLSEFFCRKLKLGIRNISSEYALLSPADGTVVNFGPVKGNRIEQLKGVNYRIDALIGATDIPNSLKANHTKVNKYLEVEENFIEKIEKKNMYFCIIYLAPHNYHRFHSPTKWEVQMSRHFSGDLYTVSPKRTALILNKFITHERVALIGRWKYGLFSMIPVGSTNVGSITINFDKSISTNIDYTEMFEKYRSGLAYRIYYPNNIHINSGDEVGYFSLGSTIVLLFEAPIDFKFIIKPNQLVHYGQPLSNYK